MGAPEVSGSTCAGGTSDNYFRFGQSSQSRLLNANTTLKINEKINGDEE